MQDLIIREDFQKAFPGMAAGIREAAEIFDNIHSFEDIERYFLLGAGLSANTYRTYLSAVKGFYESTGGLNPLQVIPGDIERYYDELVERVDRNTAYIKIMGLKKFFKGICKKIPFYVSPFDQMTDELKEKLSKTKKDKTTKPALSKKQLHKLFEYLDRDKSLKGLQNKAIIKILVSTGLRAFELCQSKWGDIELDEDTGIYYLRGDGKGGKPYRQEIADTGAIEALREAYVAQFKQEPKANNYLVYSLESYKGKEPTRMKKSTMWARFHALALEIYDIIPVKVKIKGKDGEYKEKGYLQFSAHLFRRTYLTLLLKAGMDWKAVQQHSRHASIETLAKHYADTGESAKEYFKKIMEPVA